MIIRTLPYEKNDMIQIVGIRATTEGIEIDPSAIDLLGEIGEKTSLRFVVQLLTPSNILAKSKGRNKIISEDVEEISKIFHDAKTSAQLLASSEGFVEQ